MVEELRFLTVGYVHLVSTFFSDKIHAVLEGLLVEAQRLLGQLEPDSDHVAHVHQALVQVAVLKLRRYKLDQTAKLIGQRTCMAARLVAFVEGLLLERYHEFNQESANLDHSLHDKLACSSLRIRHVLGQCSVELLKILLHILLRFGIDFGALLKYLLDLVAGTLELVTIASGLDVVINGSRQDHVNIELTGMVHGRHKLLLDQTCRLLLLRRACKLIGEGQV